MIPPRPPGAARVLHTSDWHLGAAVRGHSRADDHDALIAELVAIAAEARPDLVLHTGDLFDGPRPPMTEFGRAIRALRALAVIAPVAVLAGNHDSATALEVLGIAIGDQLGDDITAGTHDPHAPCRHRIRVHHKPGLPERGAVARYPTAAGIELRLAALPFVHANRVVVEFAELCAPNATYNDSLRQIVGHLTEACLDGFDPTRQVAVFASHLHIGGALTSSEKAIHISEDYAADAAHLDPAYGYLAFGHIHVPQAVAGDRGRYAGSLLEVDFGELGEAKQVVLADLEPGRPTRATLVHLTAGRRLHRVRTPLSTLAAQADVVGHGIAEVTVVAEPEAAGPVDRDAPVVVGGASFDTLSAAVRTVLPDATVVSVIDARNPYVAPEVPDGASASGSVEDSYRAWLAGPGATLCAAAGDGHADPTRVVELFAELHASVAGGEPPVPREVAQLEALTTPRGA